MKWNQFWQTLPGKLWNALSSGNWTLRALWKRYTGRHYLCSSSNIPLPWVTDRNGPHRSAKSSARRRTDLLGIRQRLYLCNPFQPRFIALNHLTSWVAFLPDHFDLKTWSNGSNNELEMELYIPNHDFAGLQLKSGYKSVVVWLWKFNLTQEVGGTDRI